ncbi:MAG TPA: MEDS domain-containing protein, partial [Nitrospira sp.]|nr:MEDS domain-containing protein [Nitrospira sp.]
MPASGIRGTHDIPLGSHLCLFYRRPAEFLRVTASFLKAGLNENQLCVWVLPPPLTILLALDELSYHGLNPSVLIATKQLQVVSSTECFFSDGIFEVERALSRVAAFPAMARQLGYSSVRAAGGPGQFVSEACRQAFMCYERHATPIIAELPFIGLCCYASTECLATDMFD